MEAFLDLVETDSNLLVGRNYIQELYLYLHLLGVYSAPTFCQPYNSIDDVHDPEGIRAWKDLPPVVCITLAVPRAKLRVFTDLRPEDLGTPLVQCVLGSSRM